MTGVLEYSQGVSSPRCSPALCEYSYRAVKLHQALHNHRHFRYHRFQMGLHHPNRYNTYLGPHLPQCFRVKVLNFRAVDKIHRSLL